MTEAEKQTLIDRALAARQWAYAPYSGYQVGAAVLAASGKFYDGCNVENAAYGNTVCAERTVLVKAVSEGERQFEALALVTDNGGFPCGACRQMWAEFGLDLQVLILAGAGQVLHETTLRVLLPEAFTPEKLQR